MLKELKILLFLIMSTFLISSISSFDDQLIQCGGDSELIICYTSSDDELIFLAGELPEEERDIGWRRVDVPIEEPIQFSLLAMFGLDKIKYGGGILIIFLIFLIFIFYKKKKEKEKKKNLSQ